MSPAIPWTDRALLRIFLDTFQQWHHRPVYEVVVERARNEGLEGATVVAALDGFGPLGRLHTERPWRLGSGREVAVEIVDTPERIDSFLAAVEPLLAEAVVMRERVRVVPRPSERALPP